MINRYSYDKLLKVMVTDYRSPRMSDFIHTNGYDEIVDIYRNPYESTHWAKELGIARQTLTVWFKKFDEDRLNIENKNVKYLYSLERKVKKLVDLKIRVSIERTQIINMVSKRLFRTLCQ